MVEKTNHGEIAKTKIDVDNRLNQNINDPFNQNCFDPLNIVIRSANDAINAANAAGGLFSQIPLIPRINIQFPYGCNISNNIYNLNAEKQSSPDVVRETYGTYNINLTGSGTIPIGIGDLIVTANPILLTYDKNLRKTPSIDPTVILSSNNQTITFSRAFPDGSPVQLQLNINIIFNIKSPCTTNPDPCLIEMEVSGTAQITPISNSPFITNVMLPTFPPTPPLNLGSYVLQNK